MLQVIAYCRENSCHAIVADDAEYIAFDPPRYFSARHLKLTYKVRMWFSVTISQHYLSVLFFLFMFLSPCRELWNRRSTLSGNWWRAWESQPSNCVSWRRSSGIICYPRRSWLTSIGRSSKLIQWTRLTFFYPLILFNTSHLLWDVFVVSNQYIICHKFNTGSFINTW